MIKVKLIKLPILKSIIIKDYNKLIINHIITLKDYFKCYQDRLIHYKCK